jgi:HAD superfamily hydrolase (TIGR01509 family)
MPLDVPKIKALCFDVDGTLSDTDDLWVQRLESLLTPARFLFPRRDVKSFARWLIMATETPANFLYLLFDRMHLDDEVVFLLHALQRWQKNRPKNQYWIIPKADEMLQGLHQRFPMAVVSARDQWSTLAFLDQFQLRPLFQCVATSQTCEFTKPFPHPVLWAAEQMGVKPEECLMVGDTVVDIKAGKQAGAQTVGVLCGFGERDELEKAGADLILDSTPQLYDILYREMPL